MKFNHYIVLHTVVLLQNGEVYTFGSNIYGQLGVGDLVAHAGPVHVKLPGIATQVAAGSNHTVVLTSKGEVFTFGAYQVCIENHVIHDNKKSSAIYIYIFFYIERTIGHKLVEWTK